MLRPSPTLVEHTQSQIPDSEAILTRAQHGAIYAANAFASIVVLLFHALSPLILLCAPFILLVHPYLLGRLLRALQAALRFLCVVWRWSRKGCAKPANRVMKPDGSTVVVRFLQVVVQFPHVVWRWFEKYCDAPTNPALNGPEDSIVVFIDGKEVGLSINPPVPQISLNMSLSPSLRPSIPEYISSALQPHTSPPRPAPRSDALKENVPGPAAEMSLNVMLSGSITNEAEPQARVIARELEYLKATGSVAKLVSAYPATLSLTAPPLPSPPTPVPTSSKPRRSVDTAASLSAQFEKCAESKLEGGVSATSVIAQSSTSLALPPVLADIPGSSSSKSQLPVHASIESPSHHLDIKPLRHEGTKIKQPQPASLKQSSTNPNLPAFISAPAIGGAPPFGMSVPSAGTPASRGEPIRNTPAPTPSQRPNQGCHPHSPGLASNAANFGVNTLASKLRVSKELEVCRAQLAGLQEEKRKASAEQALIVKTLKAKLRKAEADAKSAILLERACAAELQQKKTSQVSAISAMVRQCDMLTATLKRVRAERDTARSETKRIQVERDAAKSEQAKATQMATKREEGCARLQRQHDAHDTLHKAKTRLSEKHDAGQQQDIYDREVATREDELRKRNEQLEQQLTAHQELEESNERDISILNSLLQEKEERWAKHRDEREQLRKAREYFETLKQEHACLKEIWAELEAMLLARVETLEAQRAAKETECFLFISHAEKLYQAGFDAMDRKVDQLKAQRDQILNAL